MIDQVISEDIYILKNKIHRFSLNYDYILITGGAGFIGSYLSDVLIAANKHIICLDNLSTGKINNISHLLKDGKFEYININIENKDIVNETISDKKIDLILHFASRASPENYQLYPVNTLLTNSLGTHNVLNVSKEKKIPFLLASTSEVYGDPTIIPTPETFWGNVNPIGIRSCYDEGKRFSEALTMAYFREFNIDSKIVRIHNTYGPRIRADGSYSRALPKFIVQALKGDNITVYGDGSQTRSFCYISDLIYGILSTIEFGVPGDIYNLGNPEEISIYSLAKLIKQLTKSKSQITFKNLPEDDPRRRVPDITKAKSKLLWSPETSLKEGLKRTIKWFKDCIRG